jgi:hypothetical protein
MVLCAGYVDILCGSLLACGRVLPAAAVLQFHPKCTPEGPAQLLLRRTASSESASRIPPADLQAVDCFYGAQTLEALLCTLQVQGAEKGVQQLVEDIVAEVPQRSSAGVPMRRRDESMSGLARVSENAWDVDRASEWRRGCLLRLMKVLFVTCDSH